MPTFHSLPRTRTTLVAAAALVACCGANAIELADPDSDWSVRFDNTVKASTLYRLHDADPALVNTFGTGGPQALNFNAGDDNFRKHGIVSKRIDLLSELDLVYSKRYGMRLSGAAWFDAAYRGTTDAQDSANGQTPYNEFSSGTKRLAGRKAEVLDAFVFGSADFENGQKLSVRLGRHALLYGESLFFGDNGIAQAQGPIDIFKLQSSPNAQFKEIARPVPQLSTSLQLSSDISLGAYYQFRWEENRMSPAGSYFSNANPIWGSDLPQNFQGTPLYDSGNREPGNQGQFGAQLKWRLDETDLGFYVARYHDKAGQLFTAFPNPGGPGQWYFVFPEGIRTAGISATHSFGDVNVAAEASIRTNMPLVNANGIYPDGTSAPRLAKGRTAHINVSALATFGPTFLSNEAALIGELAWNRVLSKDDPDHMLDEIRTRDATAVHVIYTPYYRQVTSGLDLGVPIGLRYVLDGNSSVTGLGWGPRKSGFVNVGLEGNYLGVWQFTLTYNHFIGRAVPFVDYSPLATGGHPHYTGPGGNPLADRDNIALSLRRTF